MGNNAQGHDGIADAMKISESRRSEVVGGTIYRDENGVLRTNEHSGHYGHQWTDEKRKAFEDFMKSQNVDSSHSSTWNQ